MPLIENGVAAAADETNKPAAKAKLKALFITKGMGKTERPDLKPLRQGGPETRPAFNRASAHFVDLEQGGARAAGADLDRVGTVRERREHCSVAAAGVEREGARAQRGIRNRGQA